MCELLYSIHFRCVETLTRSRFVWRLDVQLFSSTWKTSMRVYMMSSTNTTSILPVVNMWTWAFKPTECDAEWMIASSKLIFPIPVSYNLSHFRLILIAEKDTVYDKFPTPLINRLEKHFVLTESILEPWQEVVLQAFEDWISKFYNTGYFMFN